MDLVDRFQMFSKPGGFFLKDERGLLDLTELQLNSHQRVNFLVNVTLLSVCCLTDLHTLYHDVCKKNSIFLMKSAVTFFLLLCDSADLGQPDSQIPACETW